MQFEVLHGIFFAACEAPLPPRTPFDFELQMLKSGVSRERFKCKFERALIHRGEFADSHTYRNNARIGPPASFSLHGFENGRGDSNFVHGASLNKSWAVDRPRAYPRSASYPAWCAEPPRADGRK